MLPHLSGSLNPIYNPARRGVQRFFFGAPARAFCAGHHGGSRLHVAPKPRSDHGLRVRRGDTQQRWRRTQLPLEPIKADVCGLPVITLASEEAALLGDAILASVAVGEFGSLQQACEQMVSLKGRIQPGANQQVYSRYYQLYCKLDNYMDAFSRLD